MLRSISFVLVAVFSLACVAPVSAQQQPAAGSQASIPVAVLDLALIFENHPGHKLKMEQLQASADRMKAQFQKDQENLQAKAKQASDSFTGDALNTAEVNLRKEEVELQTKARQAQNDLLKQEANAYYETYQDVMQHVEKVCNHYNVSVVLRWDSTPIDPANPSTVIRGVQRTVVYTNKDLTPVVFQLMGVPYPNSPESRTASGEPISQNK